MALIRLSAHLILQMSKVGKVPVQIPSGVDVTLNGAEVIVKGPKGELRYTHLPSVNVTLSDGTLVITRNSDEKPARAAHGLTRALLNNMVIGVSKGFERRLQIIGVGYRANATGRKITLSLGYSHPIDFHAPEGVTVQMDQEEKSVIVVSGIDKQKVGEASAQIRKFRPPEPYKGKGIRYLDEHVHRKAGKTAAK
jgi:large subunit ribosomal protein L6